MRRSGSLLAFAGFVTGTIAAAWFGSRYNPSRGDTRLWYRRLRKPAYDPPHFLFPIVWTGLYALMAFSGWRVWRKPDSSERTRALALWLAQLTANAAWSNLFFGKKRPDWALADVTLMRGLILAYIQEASRVDRLAALAFMPYLAWVSFAKKLNRDIVRLNYPQRRLLAA